MPEYGKEHVGPVESKDDETDKPTNSEVEQALRDLEEKAKEDQDADPDAEQARKDKALEEGRKELEDLKESAAEEVPDETQKDERLTEIAKEVLAGEWGVGQAARLKLAEAGIDHLEVQEEMTRVASLYLEA